MQSCLFQSGSIALPASRELHSVALREHLQQNLFWACISRIHAQVPLVTTGKLTESLPQQIPCGIDVSIMACAAFRARPIPHIEPQLIEYMPALRAGFARGIPAIHFDEERSVPEPPVSAEPAIPRTALSPVRIAANPIASRDHPHALF
jgi:hypothetical protein